MQRFADRSAHRPLREVGKVTAIWRTGRALGITFEGTMGSMIPWPSAKINAMRKGASANTLRLRKERPACATLPSLPQATTTVCHAMGLGIAAPQQTATQTATWTISVHRAKVLPAAPRAAPVATMTLGTAFTPATMTIAKKCAT